MWYPVNKKGYCIRTWSWALEAIQWSSIGISEKSTPFTRNKVTLKDAQKEWTVWDKPRANWLHSSDVPLHATRRKGISSRRPVQESQVRCAHPRRRGGCRSLASRPGTGVSGQGPVAATPPCWSLWSRPQMTRSPVTTYPSSMRISHHWWMGTYIQGCVFNDFFRHDIYGFPVMWLLFCYDSYSSVWNS